MQSSKTYDTQIIVPEAIQIRMCKIPVLKLAF